MANTKWVFMNDADIDVKADTMDFVTDLVQQTIVPPPVKLMNRASTENMDPVYIYFKRWRPAGFKNHPAVMLIQRKHYWYLGGCDEDFVGHYGHTDSHFRLKIKFDPNLHGYKTADLMDAKKISPLVEMDDDIACPAGMTCLDPYVGHDCEVP